MNARAPRERTPLTEQFALDLPDAADFLSLSVPFLRRLVQRGDLHTFHMGGCVRFLRSDLEAYAQQQHDLESPHAVTS